MAAVSSIVSIGLNRREFRGPIRPAKCRCCAKPVPVTGASPNPNRLLGRKDLGKTVVGWVAQAMADMAKQIVQAEINGDVESIRRQMAGGAVDNNESFIKTVQPFLDKHPVPDQFQEQSERARSHYPTLYDHFQRQLRQALVQASVNDGNWEDSEAWKMFKEQTQSGKVGSSAMAETKKTGVKKKKRNGLLGLSDATVADIENKVEVFVDRFLELLKLEREAELAATQQTFDNSDETTEGSGVRNDSALHDEECTSLRDLVAISSYKGLGGTEVVSFRSKQANSRLPPTSLSPGDMVCVRVFNKTGMSQCIQGSVSQICGDGESVEIAMREGWALMKLSGRPVRVDKILDLANATTYERNCEALNRLKKNALQKFNPAAKVVAVLFGEGQEVEQLAFGDGDQPASPDDESFNGTFDDSQREGIQLGLDKRRPVVIIQGPPGTGKTSVVTDLIIKAVASGDRVLATAPTNAAVDNLVERLSSSGLQVVRVGNPVRISPAVVSRSLDYLVNLELESVRKDIAKEKAVTNRALRTSCEDSERTKLEMKVKELVKRMKRQETQAPAAILQAAPVVLCTNVGASDPFMNKAGRFDLTVVDEAGQAIEPSCWIAMLRSSRTVMAGDINQLSPTVFSREALEGGLGTSLMERASALHAGALTTMLQVQYRMNSAIASWTSTEMYGGLVKSASTVGAQLLSDSPDVESNWRTTSSMLLLDTRQAYGSLAAGCEECMDYLGTGSYYNDGEADIVTEHVMALIKAGVPASSIVVQSPYLAQVHLLRTRLEDALSASHSSVAAESIDSFQGREADAVVISMVKQNLVHDPFTVLNFCCCRMLYVQVRSNDLGMVGFLADKRRINVAVTRARKHVALVCDSSTVGSNPFLRRLLQHIRVHGQVRSVQPPHLMVEFS